MKLKTEVSIRNIFASAIFPCLLIANTTSLAAVSVFNSLDEPPLVAIGPAKVINLNNQDLLMVNGQQVVIDGQTTIFDSHLNQRNTDTVIGKEALRDGDYLYVFGELVQAGILLATNVYVSDEQYVGGVSRTYMKAILDRSANSVGIAYSGNSIIDYTAALHNDELSALEKGHAIELLGTSYGSHFFADSGRIIDTNDKAGDSSGIESYVLGQRGSGIRGQRGSGIRGQRGSGIRGQRGSGIRGQRGSGIRGQRGSGIRGQRGSGIRGQRGSGIRGQRGSGIRGQRGSGIRGQRGSGIRGQRGSGIRGQRGSGIRGQRGSGIRGQRGSGIRGQRGSGIR